jgi:hypothetical protein
VTLNLIVLEVRLVGAGFNTATENEPTAAISAAVIAALKVVELTKVVVRLLPFHFTTAPVTKPEPLTVSVKAGSPATAVSGVRSIRAGITVKLTAFEVKPLGVVTVMGKVPTVVISVATIDAVNFAGLPVIGSAGMKVVKRLTPLIRTTMPFTKPVPLTVSENPLSPALTVAGEILVMDSLTTRLTGLEVPPPGAGFETVIG